ncbi:MAG TPA: 50S ribosomal protein L10 [Actinomycetota bacterium]
MPKTQKVQKVTELAERIRGSEALFIADYRGLTVSEVTELRRSLRGSGTKFTVAKNTLLKRAAGEAGVAGLDELLAGPTAVAFVDGDPIDAAKGLVDALRRFRTLEIRGGYMEGKVMSSAEAQALATIEPREVLLAKLAGAMKAEMSRAAYMFQALQSKFLSVLEAYREKLPAEAGEEPPAGTTAEPGAGAAAPPPEAAAEAEPEPEAPAATDAGADAGTPEPASEDDAEPPASATDESDETSAEATGPAESEGKE